MKREDIIGKILMKSRESMSVSQYEMAKMLKRSRSTIQNWESGYSIPTITDFFSWYEALGVNPGPSFYAMLRPELFHGISGTDSDQKIIEALHKEIDSLTLQEARGVLYILHTYHGGDRYAIIQETIANLQTSMRCRQSVCNTIIHNYEDAVEMNEIINPDNVQPDMEALKEAFQKGRIAARSGQNKYI